MKKDEQLKISEAINGYWKYLALFSKFNDYFRNPDMSMGEQVIHSLVEMFKRFGAKKAILVPGTRKEAKELEIVFKGIKAGKLHSLETGQAQIYNRWEKNYFSSVLNTCKINSLLLIPILINEQVAYIIAFCDKKSGEEFDLMERTIASVWALLTSQSVAGEVDQLNSLMGRSRVLKELMKEDFMGFLKGIKTEGKTVKKEKSFVPEHYRLGTRNIGVLIVDLRKFTDMTAQLDQNNGDEEIVSKMISEYVDLCAGIIHSNKGTVSNIMGDAILALFGASVDENSTAKNICHRALISATEIRRRMKPVFRRWKDSPDMLGGPRQYVDIDLGIGMAFGRCTLTEFAIEEKGLRQYTAFGLDVNIAQRLESMSNKKLNVVEDIEFLDGFETNRKMYRTSSILVSNHFFQKCDQDFLDENNISYRKTKLSAKDFPNLIAYEMRVRK